MLGNIKKTKASERKEKSQSKIIKAIKASASREPKNWLAYEDYCDWHDSK